MDGNYISFSEDERSSKEKAISEKLKDIISGKKQLPDGVDMKIDSSGVYLSTHFEDYLSVDGVRDAILYSNDSLTGIFIYDKSYVEHNKFFNNSKLIDTQYILDDRDGKELYGSQHIINEYHKTNKTLTFPIGDKEMTDQFDHNIQFWHKILCEDK